MEDPIVKKWQSNEKRKRFKTEHPWFSLMQVSLHSDGNVVEFLASIYSAFVWPAAWFIWLPIGILHAFSTDRDLKFLSWFVYIFLCHEISRQILKPRFKMLRPTRSLSSHPYGFPSNHSLTTMVILVLCLNHIAIYELPPIYTFISYIGLMPILPSRVILQDHTIVQVGLGGLIGIGFGFIGVLLGL